MGFRALVADNLIGIHRRTEDESQDAADLLVNNRHRHLAFLYEFLEIVAEMVVIKGELLATNITIARCSHLDVKTSCSSLPRVGHSIPVTDKTAVPSPFFLQYAIEQLVILAAMYVFPQIIATHDRIYMRLLDSTLKGGKVYLTHSTFGDVYINREAVCLLVVEDKMLQAACYAILLHRQDIWHDHLASQQGVFTHVFEGTTVERCAGDIDTRAQHDIFSAIGKLLADAGTIEAREVTVPCCSKTRQRRKGNAEVIGPSGSLPFIPHQFFTNTMRTIVHIELADTKTRNTSRGELTLGMKYLNLLVKSHATKSIFDTFLNRSLGIKINLCVEGKGSHQKRGREQK